MRKLMSLLVYLWPLSFLFSNPLEINEDRDVATTEGLPSSIVDNCVSAITGEYTTSSVDLVVAGPEPYVVSRVYNSGSGWMMNHHRDYLIHGDGVLRRNNKPVWLLILRQASGTQLEYKCPMDGSKKKLDFDLIAPKGLTNGASSLSGRTNLKSQTVTLFPEKHQVEVVSGAGVKKIFERSGHTDEGWPKSSLLWVENPNGTHLKYEPSKSHLKISTKSQNRDLCWVSFDGYDSLKQDTSQIVTTSDQRRVDYRFLRHKFHTTQNYKGGSNTTHFTQQYLTYVDNHYAPTEHYKYRKKAAGKQLQICEKELPEKRFLQIEYYRKGLNYVGKAIGNLDVFDDDPRLDRVKRLRARVGFNEKPITLYRFDYECKVRKQRDGSKKVSEGYTDVYDAKHHKTRYTYDEDHRLTSILRYSGIKDYTPYSEECYLWNEEGNLIGKIFKDGKGNVHHARYFSYDGHGNVIESKLCGNLTGRYQTTLSLDRSQKPTGAYEQEIKKYSYTNDGLNLLKEETFSNGKRVVYEYKHHTDLLKAKYTYDKDKLKIREFCFYDDNNLIIKKVIDDGTHTTYENLSGITERHYTLMTQRTEAPFGLPESVEERYAMENKKELLSRKEYEYTKEGRVEKEKVFDSDNHPQYALKWEYDKHGNIISEKNANGDTITRLYDLNNNLLEQYDSSQEFSIKNTYDLANRLVEQKEVHGNGKEFSINHFYDNSGNCRKTINAYGHKTSKRYDDFNRVIQIFYPEVLSEDGKLKRPYIKKAYDIAGYPILWVDSTKGKTKIEYNIRGQPTKITYPDETIEQMFYSLDGQLVEKIAKDGSHTIYERDFLGRITKETLQSEGRSYKTVLNEYSSFHLRKTTDLDGITTYTYDKAGRLIETSKNDQLTQFSYDKLGRLEETKEIYGNAGEYKSTIRKYDLLNRLSDEIVQLGTAELRKTHYEYVRGNRTVSQIGDQITKTTYDSHNQPILIQDPLGNETHIEYDYHCINSERQQVLQTITTDPLGYKTVDTYDAANQLVETIRLNPFGQKVGRRVITYDLRGNQSRILDEVIEAGDLKKTIETRYTYTPDNQVEELIEANGTPEQKITRNQYKNGQKIATTKPNGIILHYEYDPISRLDKLESSDKTIAYQYEYDAFDRVRKVEDLVTNQTTERIYQKGNLTTETLANGLTLQYTYDRIGRVKTIKFPDDTGVEYTYDAANLKEVHRTIKGKRSYTYTQQTHNLSGQVTKALLPAKSGSIDYTYDAIGHCISLSTPSFKQEIPKEGFDKAGNLLHYKAQNISYDFSYDDHYQLKSENGHTYSYDSLSNRKSKDDEKFEHNALNQIANDDFVYKNGNLIEKKGLQYTYDALDRLIAVNHNGKITEYTYDPFNRRLTKKQNGTEEHFIYQGQEEVALWKQGAMQELRLLSTNNFTPMIALEIKGTPYVPIHDISGNVVSLLNHQGQVVERYRYTAFGECEVLSPSGDPRAKSSIGNSYQFASKRLDPESGLIAFGLRYYDPSLGRWLTQDPIGFEDGPNLYAYVHNNPLTYYDQFGLWGLQGYGLENDFLENPYYSNNVIELDYKGLPGSPVKHVSIEQNISKGYPFNTKSPYNVTGTYCINDFFDPNTCQKYNFKEFPANKRIVYINGVSNEIQDFKGSLLHLAELSGGYNVQGVFCPTYGISLDGLFYANAKNDLIAYEGVRELHKISRDFDTKSSTGATMLLFPHSRGCSYTNVSLIDSPKNLRDRIEVIAIAPGKYIDDNLCKKSWHYRCEWDPVAGFDSDGRSRCKRFTTVLKPIKGESLHSFTSKVYSDSIEKEIKKYMKN